MKILELRSQKLMATRRTTPCIWPLIRFRKRKWGRDPKKSQSLRLTQAGQCLFGPRLLSFSCSQMSLTPRAQHNLRIPLVYIEDIPPKGYYPCLSPLERRKNEVGKVMSFLRRSGTVIWCPPQYRYYEWIHPSNCSWTYA